MAYYSEIRAEQERGGTARKRARQPGFAGFVSSDAKILPFLPFSVSKKRSFLLISELVKNRLIFFYYCL